MAKTQENRLKRWTVIGAWGVAILFVIVIVGPHWSSLQCIYVACEDGLFTSTEDLRNLAWVLAAVIALPIFVWRGWVGDQQAVAANLQAKTDSQRELQQRFQKAATMLAGKDDASRLAGIYALDRIARDNPEDYHMQIVQTLCAFVRYSEKPKPDNAESGDSNSDSVPCHGYVEAAAVVIGKRDKRKQIPLEKKWKLNFVKAHLVEAILVDLNFSRAWLHYANLSGAVLQGTDLSNARLQRANLSDASFLGTNLENAILHNANLTSADLTKVKKLAQWQLDDAIAETGSPPNLDGVVCWISGEPLEWDDSKDYPPDDDVPF